MRIAFAGTPEFAARSLAALIDAAPRRGWTLPLVLSQPERPAGRGMKSSPSAVEVLARANQLAVATPASLRKGDDATQAIERLHAARPDLLVVAAYGLILPQSVLDIPTGIMIAEGRRVTAINVHASLLPRWRGAAPVARAIEGGDSTTGITLMEMDAGLDTGPLLLAEPTSIGDDETTAELTVRLADLGAKALVTALERPTSLRAQSQPSGGATYASKIDKAEASLDWSADAEALARKVRAFDPFPVASAQLAGTRIRIWRAAALNAYGGAAPGTVLAATSEGVDVACGRGVLRMLELQRPGGRRLPAREFLSGQPIHAQQRFDSIAAHG